jgi:hypothetical protein
MSQDLSIIIDPGGNAGVREGINLRVFPSGDSPLTFTDTGMEVERIGSGTLASGGFEEFQNFDFQFFMSTQDYFKLRGLNSFNRKRRQGNKSWETVIYNLVTPFVEESAARTRFKVPGTDVILQEGIDNGLYRWIYWVALQGHLNMNFTQRGILWLVNANFTEGTILTSDMEA